MSEGASSADKIPNSQFDHTELLRLDNIHTKDQNTIARLDKALYILEGKRGLKFGNGIERLSPDKIKENEVGGNNSVFFVQDNEGRPTVVIKIFRTDLEDMGDIGRYAREQKFFNLLSANLPTNQSRLIPEEIASDETIGARIMSYEEQNLLKDGDPNFLLEVVDYIKTLDDIKPKDSNVELFPDEAFTPTLIPVQLLRDAQTRIITFQEFIDNPGEHQKNHELFLKSVKDDEILELIKREVQLLEPLRTKEILSAELPLEAQRWHTDDPGTANFRYRLLDNKPTICRIDGEYAGLNDLLTLPASFVLHPGNRIFSKKLKIAFLDAVVSELKLSKTEIARLNGLLAFMHYDWISVIARNTIPGRRPNWKKNTGVRFKSRDEYLTGYELPVLKEMLEEGPFVYQIK